MKIQISVTIDTETKISETSILSDNNSCGYIKRSNIDIPIIDIVAKDVNEILVRNPELIIK